MNDMTFFLSKETREHHPYRSLYAALLFQSFQDALAEAMTEDSPNDRDEAAPRMRRAVPAGHSALGPAGVNRNRSFRCDTSVVEDVAMCAQYGGSAGPV